MPEEAKPQVPDLSDPHIVPHKTAPHTGIYPSLKMVANKLPEDQLSPPDQELLEDQAAHYHSDPWGSSDPGLQSPPSPNNVPPPYKMAPLPSFCVLALGPYTPSRPACPYGPSQLLRASKYHVS